MVEKVRILRGLRHLSLAPRPDWMKAKLAFKTGCAGVG